MLSNLSNTLRKKQETKKNIIRTSLYHICDLLRPHVFAGSRCKIKTNSVRHEKSGIVCKHELHFFSFLFLFYILFYGDFVLVYTIRNFQTQYKLCGNTFVHFDSCRSRNLSRNIEWCTHWQEGGVSYKLEAIVIDLDPNNKSL